MRKGFLISAVILAAGLCTLTASCAPGASNTLANTVTFEFDDTYEFSPKGCHGIQMSNDIPGTCIVTCEDVEKPQIEFRFTFSGAGTKKLQEQYDNLKVEKSLEYGILSLTTVDGTTGYRARSSKNPIKEDWDGIVFRNSYVDITLTLPKCFDKYDISNYNGDLAVKDIRGNIDLYTYKELTAENVAFNGNKENMVEGEQGVFISTVRYNSSRINALVMSRYGAITYVMPPVKQMVTSGSPDTIEIMAFEDDITVDLNGNICRDTMWFDKDKNLYNYDIAGNARLNFSGTSAYEFTNGDYIPEDKE